MICIKNARGDQAHCVCVSCVSVCELVVLRLCLGLRIDGCSIYCTTSGSSSTITDHLRVLSPQIRTRSCRDARAEYQHHGHSHIGWHIAVRVEELRVEECEANAKGLCRCIEQAGGGALWLGKGQFSAELEANRQVACHEEAAELGLGFQFRASLVVLVAALTQAARRSDRQLLCGLCPA